MDAGAARGGDHAAHQGDHAGASLRPAGRHGRRSSTIADAPRPAGDRGRLPGARRRVQGPAASAALGDVGCFSFYPGKNLGAYGEGGMVVTSNDGACAKTIRMLRDWGQEKKYHHVLKGFNYRMEGIQGAILRVKLRHLESWTEARRARARRLRPRCSPAAASQTPVEAPRRAARLPHLRRAHARSRRRCSGRCRRNGIGTGIHYPIPVHLQPALRGPRLQARATSRTSERAADEVLSLPMFPELTVTQVEAGRRGRSGRRRMSADTPAQAASSRRCTDAARSRRDPRLRARARGIAARSLTARRGLVELYARFDCTATGRSTR